MNYSEWSSHEYNSYKNDPKHYNSSEEEKQNILDTHAVVSDKSKKTSLKEWATLSYGGNGGPSIEGDNHGMTHDRLGLVIDHLGEVRTNLNKESVHEFVQDAQGWMKRMDDLK